MDDYSALFGEQLPPGAADSNLELADLGGSGAELSTGLILVWRDYLVFGIEPRAHPLGARGRSDVAAFVGIGGHLDDGESWGQAAMREAMEEANTSVALGDSPITYWCPEDSTPQPISFRWTEPCRPLLVWTATFMLRRGPLHERIPVTLVNAVFRAAALGQPTPGAEMQALILMNQEVLRYSYLAPRTLGELLAKGAQVIGDCIPTETLIAPGGSAYFYARWLEWQA